MGAARTTIVLALSTSAAGAFDEALTRTPAPTRRLSLTRAPVEWLVGASVASQPVHGFRSEVAGPAPGELARIDVEGAPSPLSDSSLIRVAVQVRRTGTGGVALRNGWARVSFFSSEVAQWQRTGQPVWQPADEPAGFVFDDLSRGDTRMVFFHVDALQRFGSGIGAVEVGAIDTRLPFTLEPGGLPSSAGRPQDLADVASLERLLPAKERSARGEVISAAHGV